MEGQEVSNPFYRYIRPTRFDETRLEFNTQPRGGICLRFEETPEAGLWFTFSRCHPEDPFNKALAKKLADARAVVIKSDPAALAAIGAIGYSQDVTELAASVIDHCRSWKWSSSIGPLVAHYMGIEWLGFADALDELMAANHREKEKGRIWLTAARAMEMASIYASYGPADV
jgi:hypothetical protein